MDKLIITAALPGAEVTRAPDGALVLASSPHCAVQALSVGTHAFSMQFHAYDTLQG